jgi:hypothetical protein
MGKLLNTQQFQFCPALIVLPAKVKTTGAVVMAAPTIDVRRRNISVAPEGLRQNFSPTISSLLRQSAAAFAGSSA